jgi:hypothetical protein
MRVLMSGAIAAALLSGVIAPAAAIPPTVTPSPGYDARLAEQRRAAREQPKLLVPAPGPHRSMTHPRKHRYRR